MKRETRGGPTALALCLLFDLLSGYTLYIPNRGRIAVVTKIQKWGNSQGLRVTRALLEEAQLGVGDEVAISVRRGQIIVEPVKKGRRKHDLKKLVAKIPSSYRAEELDWNLPVGKEAW